eukprot:1605097-Amphidinium_carterae.1
MSTQMENIGWVRTVPCRLVRSRNTKAASTSSQKNSLNDNVNSFKLLESTSTDSVNCSRIDNAATNFASV